MTVTYTAEVATSNSTCFLKLLLRWRASIYKLLWKDFLLFAFFFFLLSFIYRFGLNADQKHIFEQMAIYCDTFNNLIPVSFVLGFYVTLVVGRWWDQFNSIPWPDRLALFVTAHIHGHDERGRMMRRTLMRYVCLAYLITMSSICSPVKKRFQNFTKMTEAGFMLANEQKILENIKASFNKYFIPLVWSTSIITRARKEGRIKDDFAVKTLIDEVNSFRGMLGSLFNYDWISIPLVYTQVVTIAVYMFFISCLMGRQFLEHDGDTPDMYFPLFTFLQFFFYMGWLKVAEVLVNPFGEDDDDFDINTLIDRNLTLSYLVVDEMHAEHPEFIKDAYWDEENFELPYTAAAESFRPTSMFLGSAMNIELPPEQREFVPLSSVAEEACTTPQDIPPADPKHRLTHMNLKQLNRNDQSSVKISNPWHRFKRTLSRDSRNTNPDSTLSLANIRVNVHPRHRGDSLSSHGSTDHPSPTATMRTEDIFAMSDVDEPLEDELDNLLDAALAEVEPEKQRNLLQQLVIRRASSTRSVRSSKSATSKDVKEDGRIDAASIASSRGGLQTDQLAPIREGREGLVQSHSDHTGRLVNEGRSLDNSPLSSDKIQVHPHRSVSMDPDLLSDNESPSMQHLIKKPKV